MKKERILLSTLLLALLTLSSQCKKEETAGPKSNLAELVVTLDQTAWFCAGDCRYNFVFQEDEITTRHYDAPIDETPEWTCVRTLSSKNWAAIVEALDLNALAQTDTTIGCPGCADAPIETLSVESGDFSRQIRMNMNAEVPAIQPLLDELRKQASGLKNEENCQ